MFGLKSGHKLSRIIAAVILAIGTCVNLVHGAVPSVPRQISFQAKVTNAGGSPVADGMHSVSFELYFWQTSGVALWNEGPVSLNTSGGLFTHNLGSADPLPLTLPDWDSLWLQITFEGEVQVPRIRLVSAPSAQVADGLEVRSPNAEVNVISTDRSSGDLVIGEPDMGVEKVRLGTEGGDYGRLRLDGFTSDHWVRLQAGDQFFTGPKFEMRYVGQQGIVLNPSAGGSLTMTRTNGLTGAYLGGNDFEGQLLLSDAAGATRVSAQADGTLRLRRSSGSLGLTAKGGIGEDGASIELTNASAVETVELFGGSNSSGGYLNLKDASGVSGISMHGDWTGDNSVQLPDGAISGDEILNSSVTRDDIFDEPGVANDVVSTVVGFSLTGGFDVIAVRTITVPTDGYVLALGSVDGRANHTFGTDSRVQFGVSDSPSSFDMYQYIEVPSELPTAGGDYSFPVTSQNLYPVTAGAHTFYFNAVESQGDWYIFSRTMTLLFFPGSYGTTEAPGASVITSQPPASGDTETAVSTGTPSQSEALVSETFAVTGVPWLAGSPASKAELDAIRAEVAELRAMLAQQASNQKPE